MPAYNCEHWIHVFDISARLDETLLDTNSKHSKILFRSSYMMWKLLQIKNTNQIIIQMLNTKSVLYVYIIYCGLFAKW